MLSISIILSNKIIDISSDVLLNPQDFKVFAMLHVHWKESKQFLLYTNKREVTFQTSLFRRTMNYKNYSELLKLQPYFVSRFMFFQTLQQDQTRSSVYQKRTNSPRAEVCPKANISYSWTLSLTAYSVIPPEILFFSYPAVFAPAPYKAHVCTTPEGVILSCTFTTVNVQDSKMAPVLL